MNININYSETFFVCYSKDSKIRIWMKKYPYWKFVAFHSVENNVD